MRVANLGWIGAVLLFVAALPVGASSGGITGFSGNPASGGVFCTVCHSGGAVPTVTLNGPTVVVPGTVHTYTLTISGGQQVAGGFDVSTDAGSLAVNLADGGSRFQSGEITHTQPRRVDASLEVVWSFDWRAPTTPGSATLYGAGNSVNLSTGTGGDNANRTSLRITVAVATGTPGESSAAGLQPLKATDYNTATGEISISYETGCDTDDNNVYYGQLSQVSSLLWINEICDIGTSGSAVIQPAGSSIFFVVVGNKDGKDGSYGVDSDGLERIVIPLNTCGEVQDLSDACLP